ncbi:MAG: two-component sensor histidine kinase [Mitsuaria chitosanitabida]|uniref:HAMP domain-containing sensor histidine kinase n=1 Tax=Roseateles chitosanitabidus TaxID=65048 RepID=UPI001B2533D0|nr:ATP-binding protein [Roseateles chitosanitabidus]MBO9688786.1 two-component sensor histidine kinase [Roseateles chitosanitabidus]
MLNRISFRQMLLIGFLSIAGLLAGASLGGLLTLERLTMQSREAVLRGARMSSEVQQLGDRSVSMERAARQFLVLEDRALRQRFEDDAADAEHLLQLLRTQGLTPAPLDAWAARLGEIRALLDAGPRAAPPRKRELDLTAKFRDLGSLTAGLSEDVRRHAEVNNRVLQDKLENGRVLLGQQVLGAIAIAALLSLVFGIFLTRPLKRLERAIAGLGENRLDDRIEIPGPSDLRSIGQRLDWLRLRLGELDADKARFLRHVSHELKTPLAALREGTALLEDEVAGPLNDKQKEVARILRDNTAVLQRQIEDLLRFNAAAFEARDLKPQRTELMSLIQGTIADQRLQWQARGLHVTVSGGPLEADVDPAKFGAAVGNLLSNAIRFAPPGGRVDIVLARQDGQLTIDLRDDGPGVAPADQARIFEPFYRGERQPEDALKGTGIGLSIVQEYIAAHGGHIDLLPSDPGAHFRITLPCAHPPRSLKSSHA